jgi:hypothetical protein
VARAGLSLPQLSDQCDWRLTCTGPGDVLQTIADRLSAGLGEAWSRDRCDVECHLHPHLRGGWGDCMPGPWAVWITAALGPGTPAAYHLSDGELVFRGRTAFVPLPLAERITQLFPGVTVSVYGRDAEETVWTEWESRGGQTCRTGRGTFSRPDFDRVLDARLDPQSAPHHTAPVLTSEEVLRLVGEPVVPRPLSQRPEPPRGQQEVWSWE